jgi:hypothetical protein
MVVTQPRQKKLTPLSLTEMEAKLGLNAMPVLADLPAGHAMLATSGADAAAAAEPELDCLTQMSPAEDDEDDEDDEAAAPAADASDVMDDDDVDDSSPPAASDDDDDEVGENEHQEGADEEESMQGDEAVPVAASSSTKRTPEACSN